MKNVLVLIHDDPGQESRLQAALDLVRALGGHLACAQVITPPDVPPEVAIAIGGAPITVGGGTTMLQAVEREAANRARTQRRLESENVPWSWTETSGDLAGALGDAFALTDIIVLNRALHSSIPVSMARVAADAIMHSGKPVVAVPEDARGFAASEGALIAWDGSIEASAAVTACVPLLKKASRVTILEIDDGSVIAPAEEAALYLSRHGIRALVLREAKVGGSVPELIVRAVARLGAAYVVMGGFGRSRVAEALLGGVSHDLLRDSPVPLVLVH